MTELPLCSPPNYEYRTTGPWWVVHVTAENEAKAWTMWTFESAIMRFWLTPEPSPPRKLMIDAMGITVLGTMVDPAGMPHMCGTREAMEATLTLVRRSNESFESEADIVIMMECVREMNGQAL